MTRYEVSALCPHCGELTFLDVMEEARFRHSEPGLIGILHTLVCDDCGKRFGTRGGRLQRKKVD